MCKPPAISFAETGSLVTCRKRNMLSGLKEDGRGIRRIVFLNNPGCKRWGLSLSPIAEILARGILVTFLHFHRNFFRSAGIIYVGQHTTGQPPSVRLAGHPRKGTRGGGTTWPASSFCFHNNLHDLLDSRSEFPDQYSQWCPGFVLRRRLVAGGAHWDRRARRGERFQGADVHR
jgi:hypothetical protein